MNLMIFTIVFISAVVFVLYNRQVMYLGLRFLSFLNKALFSKFRNKVARADANYRRKRVFSKRSKWYKFYTSHEKTLDNFDLLSAGVTVYGFMMTLTVVALGLAISVAVVLESPSMLLVGFFAIYYLLMSLCRLMSLSYLESKETKVLEAVDLLVSDMASGAQNAIERYKDSVHPDLQPYFREFLDNVRFERYTFEVAMRSLAEKLGGSFEDFAQKAIYLDRNSSEDAGVIFSSILEKNMAIRRFREDSKATFNDIKATSLVAMAMILGYGLAAMASDEWLRNFLLNTFWGNIVVYQVFGVVAYIVGFLSVLRGKSFGGS